MQRLRRRGAGALSSSELLGAVLAGGESRRFGSNKAAAVVGGQTLVARAAATLAEVFPSVVVIASPADVASGWPVIPDLRAGMGPLAGIETALARATELGLDGAFVLACDLPLVDASTVRAVVAALEAGATASAPAAPDPPGVQPLCAAYRLGCLPVIRRALDADELAVHRLFSAVGGVTTDVPRRALVNVNRPADRARAEAALRHRSP